MSPFVRVKYGPVLQECYDRSNCYRITKKTRRKGERPDVVDKKPRVVRSTHIQILNRTPYYTRAHSSVRRPMKSPATSTSPDVENTRAQTRRERARKTCPHARRVESLTRADPPIDINHHAMPTHVPLRGGLSDAACQQGTALCITGHKLSLCQLLYHTPLNPLDVLIGVFRVFSGRPRRRHSPPPPVLHREKTPAPKSNQPSAWLKCKFPELTANLR